MEDKTSSLSDKLKEIYRQYLEDGGGDPTLGLKLVTNLLTEYPYYTEALLFKARMLMARGCYEKAEECIKDIKRIDHWDKSYIYDEAELLYRKDAKAGINYIHEQLEELIKDIVNGIDNFLLAANEDDREHIQSELLNAVITAFKAKWKESIQEGNR